MIVITGGAGFIGSALLWALNERGRDDIIVVDQINHDQKELNLAPLRYEQLLSIDEFRRQLSEGRLNKMDISAIFHLGACADTTETSWPYLLDNNVHYSQEIIRYCYDLNIRCMYASSGAIYGDGAQGYSDEHELFDMFKPLNLYGKSKLTVDVWARDGGFLDKVVGLRYFNVFGPNEYHKDEMRSVVLKKFEQFQKEGVIELYKSYRDDFADGEQKRDFIYIKDAVAATLFFFDNPELNGVFNIGTGTATTWNEVAKALAKALQKKPNIRYIDMPKQLRSQYQYFTQADISKLKEAGFTKKMQSVPKAMEEYVNDYLVANKHLGKT